MNVYKNNTQADQVSCLNITILNRKQYKLYKTWTDMFSILKKATEAVETIGKATERTTKRLGITNYI